MSSSSALQTTDYHAKFYAHLLTQRHSGDSPDKLASSLADALVDLNPHQIDAALFAFKSPLSNGVILADEVGLGKTIEAGLVISQFWAERKRRILVLTPANLRKQWQAELEDKFHLPSKLIEGQSYNESRRRNPRGNPFDLAKQKVAIASIPFAARKSDDLANFAWDLVVIDEAHRLRNADGKQATALRESITATKKLLLTATPLQNRPEELWGLTSQIDRYFFGDLKSFRARYSDRYLDETAFADLRRRIKPLIQRTLRRDVSEFIRFPERHAMTVPFVPTTEERELYAMVSRYLRRENLMALPRGQRHLMRMVLWKLLASSTGAIAGALRTMADRLERELRGAKARTLVDELEEDLEALDETIDEWEVPVDIDSPLDMSRPEQIAAIKREIRDLTAFAEKAESIVHNAKGSALIKGLHEAFRSAAGKGAPRKAIVFTESRRTQKYLYRLLSSQPEFVDKIVLFDGSNSDPKSTEIYQAWKVRHAGTDEVRESRSANIRAALVEHFRDHAEIMIATEAAAEGINLQFCALVINYDLPWNPQRVEQRIGRCHRYGQEHPVLVVNFLNQENEADRRVLDLLTEKFHLFEGIFGATDTVLGSVGSGVDIEREIAEIYQNARTAEEVQREFEKMQAKLIEVIEEKRSLTERKLFEHFDVDVASRFARRGNGMERSLNRIDQALMHVAHHELRDHAHFMSDRSFELLGRPLKDSTIPLGHYRIALQGEHNLGNGAHIFRPSHPLSEQVVARAAGRKLPSAVIVLDYAALPGKQSAVEPLVGSAGWLRVTKLSIEMDAGAEDHLLLAGFTDSGATLDSGQIETLLRIPGKVESRIDQHPDISTELDRITHVCREDTVESLQSKIMIWFEEEQAKLDAWADDRRLNLEGELDNLDAQIRTLKRDYQRAATVSDQLEIQTERNRLMRRRDDLADRNREERQRIYREQDRLMHKVRDRFDQETTEEKLFTVRWRLI